MVNSLNRPPRLVVRTSGFHPGDSSSILLGATYNCESSGLLAVWDGYLNETDLHALSSNGETPVCGQT